ncbi:MAG: P-loop NTPase [Thermoplasmata archaeon]|nr:Mrp/NBP35 family ATP-binding protein [Thermoplasmata archaeon]
MTIDPSKLKPILQQNTKLEQRMKNIKYKILVMSGKGGVGKTTVSVNLAVALSLKGYKVGLLDSDLHGPDVPMMLGLNKEQLVGDDQGILPIEYSPTLKVISIGNMLPEEDAPVIWRGSLKHKALQQFLEEVQWGELDFLIVDLPPGTGDEPLSIVQLIKDVTGIVIVITPQEVALLDAKKAINFSKHLNVKILGIIENMAGYVFGTGGGEKAANKYQVPFLGRIPMDPSIVKAGDDGEPFILKESEASRSFSEIVEKIISQLPKKE